MSKKIILIAGPTASGKSKIAIEIAKKIKGEIINADSMQVYKEFSILTSRPSTIDLKKTKHHLYGFQSVKKHFSTGAWLELVKKQVNLCLKNKKTPILVGGTGLYFEAITKGISKIPNINFKARNKIRELQKKLGQKKFYENLLKLDPLIKNKIKPYDTQRSVRAYEVKRFTKKSIFEILLMPLMIASKYNPVPPTRIGIFLFFKHLLICFLTNSNQAPVEKCSFTD